MSNLDPVTLTVIQNGLIQVCNEMDLAFVRAAFSPVISEGMDRSDGIYDTVEAFVQGEPAAVGRVIAWARRGPPAARVDGVEVHDVALDAKLEGFARWATR